MNIELFSGNLKDFTAAGDENGLFIIVPKGRKWFPGCAEAEIFPIKAYIRAGVEKELEFSSLPYKIFLQ